EILRWNYESTYVSGWPSGLRRQTQDVACSVAECWAFWSTYVGNAKDVGFGSCKKLLTLLYMEYLSYYERNKTKALNQNVHVRSGIRTHAHIRGPEHSILCHRASNCLSLAP
ncbi:hypothetical protein NPIL_213291, partial [Nephila pilipes]